MEDIKFPTMELKEIEEIGKKIFGANEKNYRHYLYQLFFRKDSIAQEVKFSKRFKLLCEQEVKNYALSKKSEEIATLFAEVLKYFREKGFLNDQQFNEEYEVCKKILEKIYK
jgi:hypothetical protein